MWIIFQQNENEENSSAQNLPVQNIYCRRTKSYLPPEQAIVCKKPTPKLKTTLKAVCSFQNSF